MTPDPASVTEPGHCITCGDEGIVMRVAERRRDGITICVDGLQQRHAVLTELVEQVGPGDTLLVHAGVAIAKLKAAP